MPCYQAIEVFTRKVQNIRNLKEHFDHYIFALFGYNKLIVRLLGGLNFGPLTKLMECRADWLEKYLFFLFHII